jgi:lipid II:glycine glycyltransferase (peptidoglycan interpeptide bridge formation enzyme)
MEIVNDIECIGKNKWNAFVGTHPQGTVFQTYDMYEVYQKTSHNKPIAVAVVENGNVLGLLLAVWMWNGNVISKWVTARSIIIGGPLVADNNQKVMKLLMQRYRKALPLCTIYSEIRPIYPMDSMADLMKELGYNRKGHYNLIIDLKPELEQLFAAMHKARKREIRRAMDYGLQFKTLQTQDEIDTAVGLIKKTYKRKHVPLSNAQMLSKLGDYLDDKVQYFGAYKDDSMIAANINLCYRNLVYAWFAGSDENAFSYYPNDFLMWKLMEWSKEKGYDYLDLGGGGEPGVPYGVRDYKLKFGCQIFDYGRFMILHRPLTYKLGEFFIKKTIKK